ncbi:hypothetical protein LZ554_001253 [Drepanopeziza brunnea f. sp. 'monogermtubi']|nr:hypothetical protein LZ554_001253 [Drepanopeziza brunnea f. sp. 'monogermtubi']
MGSRVVDLTSSSPAASEQGGIPVALQPLQPPIPAGNRPNARPAPVSVVSAALSKSIDTMDHKRLRAYVKQFCQEIPEPRQAFEQYTLVKGKDVGRYHVDTDSEEDVNSETSSKDGGEEEEEEEDGSGEGRVTRFLLEKIEGRHAAIGDLSACKTILKKLHALGIIHQDVNKHNFLITEHGPVLIDFETAEKSSDTKEMEAELEGLEKQFQDESGIGGIAPEDVEDV